MASLGISIPVFIASPGDVHAEREIAAEIIEELQKKFRKDNINLSSFRWEFDARPAAQPAQDSIDKSLRRSELAIIIFGDRIGSQISITEKETGTEHELRIATENISAGITDDVFLYFKKSGTQSPEVKELKKQVRERMFYFEFESHDEFRKQFTDHLTNWIEGWKVIPKICHHVLRFSNPEVNGGAHKGENVLTNLRRSGSFDPMADQAFAEEIGLLTCSHYQRYAQDAPGYPVDAGALDVSRLNSLASPIRLSSKSKFTFESSKWFYFYCAIGLVRVLRTGKIELVDRFPYVNEVHQLLSSLIAQEPRKNKVIATLKDWLVNKDAISTNKPVARNFAAYVLGMIREKSAQDALAFASEHDDGEDVRIYAVLSLGRMRSRKYLSLMIHQWETSTDNAHKIFLGQCICNTIGISNFYL